MLLCCVLTSRRLEEEPRSSDLDGDAFFCLPPNNLDLCAFPAPPDPDGLGLGLAAPSVEAELEGDPETFSLLSSLDINQTRLPNVYNYY